ALAITAFAYSGTEAQTCKCPPKHKHKSVAVASRTTSKQKTTVASCKLVPYSVCTINPDRRSVSCFKTLDPEDLNPVQREVTYYGPDGKMPAQVDKPRVETVVIKGKSKGDYCKRDAEGKATLCFYEGKGIGRDELGNYYYR